MVFISRSNVAFSSFDARRNSVIAFPIVRPSSGNFLGPKRSSARKKMKTVSCQPSGPIVLSSSGGYFFIHHNKGRDGAGGRGARGRGARGRGGGGARGARGWGGRRRG